MVDTPAKLSKVDARPGAEQDREPGFADVVEHGAGRQRSGRGLRVVQQSLEVGQQHLPLGPGRARGLRRAGLHLRPGGDDRAHERSLHLVREGRDHALRRRVVGEGGGAVEDGRSLGRGLHRFFQA
mgnify:CR=1 FL=1